MNVRGGRRPFSYILALSFPKNKFVHELQIFVHELHFKIKFRLIVCDAGADLRHGGHQKLGGERPLLAVEFVPAPVPLYDVTGPP